MSTVDDDERLVDQFATDLVSEVHAMREAIGERPFRQQKLTEREQVQRSTLLWDAPEAAWSALLDQHGDRATRAYVERLIRLRAKYPEESSYIPPEAMLNAQ